jgi:hypothetical protein
MNNEEFQSFSDTSIENSFFGFGEIRVGLKYKKKLVPVAVYLIAGIQWQDGQVQEESGL